MFRGSVEANCLSSTVASSGSASSTRFGLGVRPSLRAIDEVSGGLDQIHAKCNRAKFGRINLSQPRATFGKGMGQTWPNGPSSLTSPNFELGPFGQVRPIPSPHVARGWLKLRDFDRTRLDPAEFGSIKFGPDSTKSGRVRPTPARFCQVWPDLRRICTGIDQTWRLRAELVWVRRSLGLGRVEVCVGQFRLASTDRRLGSANRVRPDMGRTRPIGLGSTILALGSNTMRAGSGSSAWVRRPVQVWFPSAKSELNSTDSEGGIGNM